MGGAIHKITSPPSPAPTLRRCFLPLLLVVIAQSHLHRAGHEGHKALSHNSRADLPIRVKDRRFVDVTGRERHFRGVNVVYKDAPWLPHVDSFHVNLSFVKDDVDLLASLGVNLIRLGVMWPGVVPNKRGKVDRMYIERVRKLIRMAAEVGIYTVVEPHQDEFNPRFCGEGVPDWWTAEFTKVNDFPMPVRTEPFGTTPPTRDQCNLNISFAYIWTHDCARAFQTFWEKGAEDFGAYWAAVASELAAEPSVIGGELFNEPFPGDVFGNSQWRNNQVADLKNLQPFYEKVTQTLRAAVPRGAFNLAYEPTWPTGDQDIHQEDPLTPTSGFSALPESDAIYAFHYYSPPCSKNISAYLDARLDDAKRLGAAPFASEFNLWAGDATSQQEMTQVFQEFELRQISYTGWQYKSYSGSLPGGTCTGCGNSFFNEQGLNQWLVRAMARPFVAAVAGSTTNLDFDVTSRMLVLKYRCTTTNQQPTEIIVPAVWMDAIHVTVEGDSSAQVDHVVHPGREVAPGVKIAPWRKVYIRHSVLAVDQSWPVRVTVTPISPIFHM